MILILLLFHRGLLAGQERLALAREIELGDSCGLKVRELSKAEELAESHKELIIQKWNEHINR